MLDDEVGEKLQQELDANFAIALMHGCFGILRMAFGSQKVQKAGTSREMQNLLLDTQKNMANKNQGPAKEPVKESN